MSPGTMTAPNAWWVSIPARPRHRMPLPGCAESQAFATGQAGSACAETVVIKAGQAMCRWMPFGRICQSGTYATRGWATICIIVMNGGM